MEKMKNPKITYSLQIEYVETTNKKLIENQKGKTISIENGFIDFTEEFIKSQFNLDLKDYYFSLIIGYKKLEEIRKYLSDDLGLEIFTFNYEIFRLKQTTEVMDFDDMIERGLIDKDGNIMECIMN